MSNRAGKIAKIIVRKNISSAGGGACAGSSTITLNEEKRIAIILMVRMEPACHLKAETNDVYPSFGCLLAAAAAIRKTRRVQESKSTVIVIHMKQLNSE